MFFSITQKSFSTVIKPQPLLWKVHRKVSKRVFLGNFFSSQCEERPPLPHPWRFHPGPQRPLYTHHSQRTAWAFKCPVWSDPVGLQLVKLIPVVDTLTGPRSRCSNELGRGEEDGGEGFLFVLSLNNTAQWQPANKSICVVRERYQG